jgi:hypothetical protein
MKTYPLLLLLALVGAVMVVSCGASVFSSSSGLGDVVDDVKYKSKDYVDSLWKAADDTRKKGSKLTKEAITAAKGKKSSLSDDIDNMVSNAKEKGKQYSEDAGKKLQRVNRRWLDDDDVDEAAEKLKQKGKQYSKDAAAKLKQKKDQYYEDADNAQSALKAQAKKRAAAASKKIKRSSDDIRESFENDDDDDDDEHSGWRIPVISSIADRFRGTNTDAEDTIDDVKESGKRKLQQLKERGRRFVSDDYDDDEDEDEDEDESSGWRLPLIGGLVGRLGSKAADNNAGKGVAEKSKQFLRSKGRQYSGDLEDVGDKIQKKGRQFLQEDEDEDEDEHFDNHDDDEETGWRIPIVSNIADRFRGRRSSDRSTARHYDDEDDSEAEEYDEDGEPLSDSDLGLQRKGEEYIDKAGSILRKKASSYSGDFDDATDALKRKGKLLAGLAANKLKQANRQWLQDDDLDAAADLLKKKGKLFVDIAADTIKEKKGEYASMAAKAAQKKGKDLVGAAAKTLKQKKDEYGDTIDSGVDAVKEQAKWFSGAAADGVKNANRKYLQDEDLDEVATVAKKKGRKIAEVAADGLKRKKQQYSRQFDKSADQLRRKGQRTMNDVADEFDDEYAESDDNNEAQDGGWFSGITRRFRGQSGGKDEGSTGRRSRRTKS